MAIRLPDGFPIKDIEQLCSLMADADPFVPAFEPSCYGLYSLVGQVWSLQVEEIETILLPDRNVASRLAQIAKGVAIGKEGQLIASINAFAHFFDNRLNEVVIDLGYERRSPTNETVKH